jgi:hypothetical protein
LCFQGLGYGGITPAFVDPVLFVGVDGLDRQGLAQLDQYLWHLIPCIRVADQQWDIQFTQGLAQALEVAQPKVDFARRIVMGQPLLRRDQVHRRRRATLAGGSEGGVVM